MIVLQNVSTIAGDSKNLEILSDKEQVIDCTGLTLLPAVIDPHVHFRTPGLSYKEDWQTGAMSAIKGGCTTVFDMPNTLPPTITQKTLQEKFSIIDAQLKAAKIPLQYRLFFGADKNHLAEIKQVKDTIIGIKIFMGCSTGNLVMDDDESLQAVFEIAAKENILVAVHAEDEQLIKQQKEKFKTAKDYAAHSLIRNEEVALKAVEKAISLVKKFGTRLYLLHVSTRGEIELIRQAKNAQLPVYAETTPHHLFFDDSCYQTLGGKAVVNPPLRERSHLAALFAAIADHTIDTIGSDHAPHLLSEKNLSYPDCPSGMPGIEFMLPLLLNAHSQKKLSLTDIISLTSSRARKIFSLPASTDVVLVDLQKIKTIQTTKSKCGWTPYAGLRLTGWPVYTIASGMVFVV